MSLRDLLQTPAVKRALAAGEERVGRLVTRLLADERVVHGVQSVMASALQARATLDRGLRTAAQAANLPTTGDVAELRERLGELEEMLDGLAERLDRPAPGAPAQDGAGEPPPAGRA